MGAEVISDGSYRHSFFITPAGKRAVVVVKEESKKSIAANVNLLNPGRLVVATPGQPDAHSTSGTLRIPARSAAVVMEQ